jgi:hypothetical protein
MLGVFWATWLPLFVGFGRQTKQKLVYLSAAGMSAFIIIATASSTPVFAAALAMLVLCAFRWRRYTGLATKLLLLMLIALHIVMEAPVWHLIARISAAGGSTGWHRYNIINNAIRHFSEWALVGAHNFENWGCGRDITNQYVFEGLKGGIGTMIMFLLILYKALSTLVYLSLHHGEEENHFLLWCLFATLIAHSSAFIGIAYFGQIYILWFMVLAIVGRLYQSKEKYEASAQKARSVKVCR